MDTKTKKETMKTPYVKLNTLVPGTVFLGLLAFIIFHPLLVVAGGGGTVNVPDTQIVPEQIAKPASGQTVSETITPASTVSAVGADTITMNPVVDLWYAWNRWFTSPTDGPNLPSSDTKTPGFVDGLSNPSVTIAYSESVVDHTTGTPIAKGTAVTVGQTIDLQFPALLDHNIAWFGNGFSMDSPYGHWAANAAPAARVSNRVTCLPDDYVVTFATKYGGFSENFDVYIPLMVNPPTRTVTPGSGLSCGAPVSSAGTITYPCTVTGTGALNPTFNYSSTYGEFYYRYYDYRGAGSGTSATIPGCYGNNIAMVVGATVPAGSPGGYNNSASIAPPYQLPVPSDSIAYPLTAVSAANNPPAAPTITGPTTGQVGTSYNYTFTSTDPDSNTIRYAVDWNNDGTIDQYLPSSGYVSSGTAQSQTMQWGTAGTYKFQAKAQDSLGAFSGWTSYTVTIAPPPPTNLQAVCNAAGDHVTLSWTAAPGATSYYPRTSSNPANPSCASYGWQTLSSNGTYYCYTDGMTGTSVMNFPIVTGQTYSWFVYSGDASGPNWANAANGTNFSCSPTLPDLTADFSHNVSSTLTATAGTPVTLNAYVSNLGNGSTGVPFKTTFFTNTSQSRSGATSYVFTSGIPNGFPANYGEKDGFQAPIQATFASPGTYYFQACADRDPSLAQTVAQTDPNNDCSAWGTITVYPPPATNLQASCNLAGNQVTLSWTAAPGATSYYPRMSSSDPNFSNQCASFGWQMWTDGTTCYPKPDNGVNGTSVTVSSIVSGVTYNWWTNSSGVSGTDWNNSANGPSFACVPKTLSCSGTPNPANPTGSITWSAAPVNFTPATYSWSGAGGTKSSGTASTLTSTYATSGSYSPTLTVVGTKGETFSNISCTPAVVSGMCGTAPTATLTASPDLIAQGGSSKLTYSAGGFTTPSTGTCTLTANGTIIGTTPIADSLCMISGTKPVSSINVRTVYKIICTNGATASATVNITPNFSEF
jgi:hypothetical protein